VFKMRRVQEINSTNVARRLRELRAGYSPWTCVAVYRLLAGTFALAVRRGILTRNPVDGLAPSERPKQKNAKRVAVLDGATLARFVGGGTTERWRARSSAPPRGSRWRSRRVFDGAKDATKIDVGETRLSWHALRHSAASMLATELEVPATTLAAVIGHVRCRIHVARLRA
jgi:hypothetical protein